MNTAAPKIGTTIALLAFLSLGVVGCSSPNSSGSSGAADETSTEQVQEVPETVSLEGEWKQNNSNDPENSWQSATITGDTIEVYWVGDKGDTTSLYWAGSVEIPEETETFTFDSANDTAKTDSALLASGDPSKAFTYEADELSYEVTAMGTTITVRLSRE